MRCFTESYKKTKIIISFISIYAFLFLPTAVRQTFGKDASENEKVVLSDFPTQDQPSPSDRENLMGESAKNFYYGIGEPVDYVKARYAAMLEMDPSIPKIENEDTEHFCSPAILMMIYANGYGVQKNIDLCIRLAQLYVSGTSSELEARIKHLKNMNSFFHGIFDICDDVPPDSGYRSLCDGGRKTNDFVHEMLPFDIQKRLPDQSKWSKKQINAFKHLEDVSNDYFTRRTYYELDNSGSARSEIEEDEMNQLENNFLEVLNLLEKSQFPNYSQSEYKKSEFDLKNTYTQLLNTRNFTLGTVNLTGIRVTQRRWTAYRETWVQFAALRYPNVPGDCLRKVLTDDRDAQLLILLKPTYEIPIDSLSLKGSTK